MEKLCRRPKCLVSCTQLWNLEEALDSWLRLGPAPVIPAIWATNQSIEDFLSVKKIKNFLKREKSHWDANIPIRLLPWIPTAANLEGNRSWLKFLGSCHLCGRPELSSGLVTSTWSSPGCVDNWEWTRERKISLFLLVSVSLYVRKRVSPSLWII